MSIIIKISIISFVYVLSSILLKTYRPEYLFLIRIVVVIILFYIVTDYVSTFIDEISSIFEIFNINTLHVNLLIKVVGITIVTDFITDTLNDCGESSISNVITIVSKFMVLYLTLPLINGLILFCLKIIE